MDFFSASDPFVRFADAVAVGAGAVTLLVIIQIIAMREWRQAGQRRRTRFLQRWRPLVYQAMAGDAVAWPPMRRRDTEFFLWFWNQLQETVRGESKGKLTRAAAELGVDAMALSRVASRRISRRLLGIVTLGNMRDPKYWHVLEPLVHDSHPQIALAAAQALIRINGARAVRDLMPLFAGRSDWPATRALALLEQVEPSVVTKAIARALPKADDTAAARLIEFVAAANPLELQAVMVERLRHTRDPQIWADVLRHVSDPGHLALVRHCCNHKVWFVRVQAANALARLGNLDDVDRLIAMLGDAEWWVRYRAAEALLKLPLLAPEDLAARVQAAGPDAAAMLARVAAARGGA